MDISARKHWVFYSVMLVAMIFLLGKFPHVQHLDVSEMNHVVPWYSIWMNNLLFAAAIAIPYVGGAYMFLSFVWVELILALTFFNLPFSVWLIHLVHFPLELWTFSLTRSATKHKTWSGRKVLKIMLLIGLSAFIEGVGIVWLRLLFIS